MNKKIFALIALSLSLILSQVAFADSCNGEKMKKMFQSLNLDSAQQEKIKAIKDQLRESQKSNWEQMKTIRSQIHDLIKSDKLDESKLDSLIAQKKELMATMMKTRIMAKNQIYNVLNAQQKTKFEQMMKEWEEKRMKHKQC